MNFRYKSWLAGVTVFVISFLIYSPGINGPFLFDDMPNFVNNNKVHIDNLDIKTLKDASLSSGSGILKRPVPMLSFALNYYADGAENPKSYKIVNIAIHALTGLFIYFLCHRLVLLTYPQTTQNKVISISLLVSIAWACHPLNLTSVLYVVQRMTSLSALFTVISLFFYLKARLSGSKSSLLTATLFFFFAIFSKENALLIPLYIAVIEFFIFNQSEELTLKQKSLFASSAFIILTLTVFIFTTDNFISKSYSFRDFTLTERFLTQFRVILMYQYMSLIPDISIMSIYHDNLEYSKSLVSPISTIFALLFHITLLAFAFYYRKKFKLYAFCIVMFYVAHSMESTILPLEMMHEHRNYFPLIFVLLPIFYSLVQSKLSIKLQYSAAILTVLMLASLTYIRASNWSSYPQLLLSSVIKKPNSVSTLYDAALWHYSEAIRLNSQSFDEPNAKQALDYFNKISKLDKKTTTGLYGSLRLHDLLKQDLPTNLIDEAHYRLETYPISTANSWSTLDITACRLNRACSISPLVLSSLATTFIANDTIKRLPKSQALGNLATLYMEQKKPYLALKAINEAVKLNPEDDGLRMFQSTLQKAMNELKTKN